MTLGSVNSFSQGQDTSKLLQEAERVGLELIIEWQDRTGWFRRALGAGGIGSEFLQDSWESKIHDQELKMVLCTPLLLITSREWRMFEKDI